MGTLPNLVTVDQAAELLKLHPKTVLRYIRDGRLPAARLGKSYRIARSALDAVAGVAGNPLDPPALPRATCIVDVPAVSAEAAARLSSFLQSAALAAPIETPPLQLQTAFDPLAMSLKVVLIASPSTVAQLLELLQLHLGNRG